MLYEEFDALLPKERREANRPNGGLLPRHVRDEIEKMNSWVYDTINNGACRAGFATTQEAYEDAVKKLFTSLNRVEGILSKSEEPYLFGKYITDADIRLYPTIARFDVAYYTLFMCNVWMIKEHYPGIQKWFQRLYWDESEETRGAFWKSTNFNAVSEACSSEIGHESNMLMGGQIKKGYGATPRRQFVPLGPAVEAPQTRCARCGLIAISCFKCAR